MRRISSGTFFLKRINPILVFGFLLFVAVGPWIAQSTGGTVTGSPWDFVFFAAIMAIGFYYQMKKVSSILLTRS